MNRRAFVTGLGAVLAAPRAVEAQQTGKTWKIGCLWAYPRNDEGAAPYLNALREGLRALGYVQDQNLLIEHRFAYPPDRLEENLKEFVERWRADALLVATNTLISVARRVTDSIPIVMIYATSPVESGFVKSLARPAGNITGLSFDAAPEVYGKHLEILKAASGSVSRVAVVWNEEFYRIGVAPMNLRSVMDAAKRLRLSLTFFDVTRASNIEKAYVDVMKAGLQAIYVMPDPVTFFAATQIAQLAATNRLPSIAGFRDHVEAGGLLSYGANIREMPRQTASYFDRIFKGAKPGDLPIEQPTKFELLINVKAAKDLGLTIPPSLLLRADQVIE
jgi:putative ABC transport system substrate-binding protein